MRVWKRVYESSFPHKGEKVLVISEGGRDEPWLNLTSIDWMVGQLEEQGDIITRVDSWYTGFREHYQANFQPNFENRSLDQLTWSEVKERLAQFLYTPRGMEYQYMFNFADELKCGAPEIPRINTHVMTLDHVVIHSSMDGISAMKRVKNIIDTAVRESGGHTKVRMNSYIKLTF